jgi:hypothetical protein
MRRPCGKTAGNLKLKDLSPQSLNLPITKSPFTVET